MVQNGEAKCTRKFKSQGSDEKTIYEDDMSYPKVSPSLNTYLSFLYSLWICLVYVERPNDVKNIVDF